MCFSYSVNFNADAMQSRLQLDDIPLPASGFFFSAFSHPILPVIVKQNNKLVAESMQWGLIPSWTKDETAANEMSKLGFNARGETMDEKPMFRNAFKQQRCLIPASGFFEWKTVRNKKYPYFISPTDNDSFLFAGLFEMWTNKETGEIIKSYAIITSQPNPLMKEIHNVKQRMPFILKDSQISDWLGNDPEIAKNLLSPYPQELMKAHTVSPLASSASSDRNIVLVQQKYHYPELEQELLF